MQTKPGTQKKKKKKKKKMERKQKLECNILVRIEKQLLLSSSLLIQTLTRFYNKTSSVDAV